MKNSLLVTALLLLTGCVMHPSVKLAHQPGAIDNDLVIVDARPPERKTSAVLSVNITSCNYGIARLGDEHVSPDRIRYLSDRLSSAKGAALAGKRIVVKEFSIYRNHQVKQRGGVMPNAGGVTLHALRSLECFGDRSHEGGYDVSENPAGENIAIVNITVTVDGRTLQSRAVEPAAGTPAQFPAAHEVWSRAIAQAIEQAVGDLTTQL